MNLAKLDPNLLIKIGLGAGAVLGVLYLAKKTSGVATAVYDQAVATISTTLNPASDQNAVYQGVNAVGGALVSPGGNGTNADGSWTFGGWLYDVTHSDPVNSFQAPKTQASASENMTATIGGP